MQQDPEMQPRVFTGQEKTQIQHAFASVTQAFMKQLMEHCINLPISFLRLGHKGSRYVLSLLRATQREKSYIELHFLILYGIFEMYRPLPGQTPVAGVRHCMEIHRRCEHAETLLGRSFIVGTCHSRM